MSKRKQQALQPIPYIEGKYWHHIVTINAKDGGLTKYRILMFDKEVPQFLVQIKEYEYSGTCSFIIEYAGINDEELSEEERAALGEKVGDWLLERIIEHQIFHAMEMKVNFEERGLNVCH